ncbi:MAG: radical SAM protein [Lachnospiraceae bacterium]|nr:radical SAM protein [Lachnospiraceae bacterium]
MEAEQLYEYKNCNLCPRKCGADRNKGRGYCKAGDKIKIARAGLHMWEEPCISGSRGSGAIFFSGCNLGCIFCQNKEISSGETGKEISCGRLTEIFFELKDKGANNINLVTADIYIPSIRKAIYDARMSGFDLPFILNTSGYINKESIESLDGLIDIYLPDMKYIRDKDALRYSNAPDYPDVCMAAVDEMVRQQPECVFEKTGDELILKKGVVVRHLLMPGMLIQAKMILKYLHERYGDKILLSLMSQYTPNGCLKACPEIDRPVSENEYRSLVRYAENTGITRGYIQDKTSADEAYIPDFDLSGVIKSCCGSEKGKRELS